MHNNYIVSGRIRFKEVGEVNMVAIGFSWLIIVFIAFIFIGSIISSILCFVKGKTLLGVLFVVIPAIIVLGVFYWFMFFVTGM